MSFGPVLSNTVTTKNRLEIISYMLASLWGGLVIGIAVIVFLPKEYSQLRWAFFPLSMVICIAISCLYKSPGYIQSLYNKMPGNDSSSITLTIMYFNHLRYRYIRSIMCLALLLILFTAITIYILNYQSVITVDTIIFVVIILLLIRIKCVEKRIVTGAFGNNSDEAKDLIRFILAHSEEIDFSDGDGTPKKGFLPEELVSLELLPPGQEVRL